MKLKEESIRYLLDRVKNNYKTSFKFKNLQHTYNAINRFNSIEEMIESTKEAAFYLCWLAVFSKQKRWVEAERIIRKDAESAYYYSKLIIKGRFPQGEYAINSVPFFKSCYEKEVLFLKTKGVTND